MIHPSDPFQRSSEHPEEPRNYCRPEPARGAVSLMVRYVVAVGVMLALAALVLAGIDLVLGPSGEPLLSELTDIAWLPICTGWLFISPDRSSKRCGLSCLVGRKSPGHAEPPGA